MPRCHEEPPSSNKPNQHDPALQQDIPPTSGYTFPNIDHSPYVTLPRSSPHSTDPQQYTYDEEPLPGAVSQNYPESSQRTPIHDGSYAYDSGAENQHADALSAHKRASTMYENLMGPGLRAVPTARISLVTRRASVTERSDVYVFPIEPSRLPSSHPSPGTNKSMFPQGTPYLDIDNGSHTNSSTFLSSLVEPERPRLPPPFEMGRHSQDQFNAPFVLLPGRNSEHAPHAHPGAQTPQSPNSTAHSLSMSSIPMCNNPGEWSSAPLGSASRAQFPPQRPSRKVLQRSSTRMTPDSDSPTSTGHSVSHAGRSTPDIPPSSSSLNGSSDTPTKRKKSKMHECEVCGKQFPR